MATVTNFANAFETTLTADMLGTDLTAQVQTTDGAPTSPCYLVIDPHNDDKREYVLFDGTFGATSFVTTELANRYLDGSAAASGITHAAGAIVRFSPVAQHFRNIQNSAVWLDETQTISGAKTFSVDPTLADGSSALSLTEGNAAYQPAKVADADTYGDDTTDATAHIQGLIDTVEAAGGGIVFLPRGTYRVTALTVDSNGVTIAGVGKRQSIIKASGANAAVHFDGSAGSIRYCNIRDLQVVSNGATGSGVKTTNAVECSFQNVTINGFTASGEYALNITGGSNTFYVSAYHSTFSGSYRGMYVSGQSQVAVACRVQGNTDMGVYDDATGSLYGGCSMEGNGSYGFYAFTNRPKRLDGCYFEHNGTAQVYLYATTASSFHGCYFYAGATTPTPIGIAIGNTSGGVTRNLSVTGCWFGSHSTADIEIRSGTELDIVGNYLTSTTPVVVTPGASGTGLDAPYRVQDYPAAGQVGTDLGGGPLTSGAINMAGILDINSKRALRDLGGNFSAAEGFTNALLRPSANLCFMTGSASYGGGTKVIFIADATGIPTSNPTGGGIMYVEAGALKWRGPSGTVTTVAPA